MSVDIAPAAEVVVESKIRYSGLHGSHTKKLGTDLLKAGESKSKTVLAVIPLLYEFIYVTAFHPAYYIDSTKSDKVPFILRTVQLPTLQPRSWATLLETGEPLREGGVGITAGAVNDHFYTVVRYFLPAFDQAGGKEDLRQHLPLLGQLAAFAHTPQALENSQANMLRFSPRESGKYVESVKKTEGGYRLQLMDRLLAIQGWLALDQSERLPMYEWLKNFHKAGYVFNQIMDDFDRQQTLDLLKQTENQDHPRRAEWTNPVTRVKFTLKLNARTGGKGGPGYRTTLFTDLNPRLGLDGNREYVKKCYPSFSNDLLGNWRLRSK